MTGLDELRDALLSVLPNVSHGHGHKLEPPYIIWMEEGLRDHFADNVVTIQVAHGTVGLYYKGEAPDLIARVHRALLSVGTGVMKDNHYAEDLDLNEALWDFEVIL